MTKPAKPGAVQQIVSVTLNPAVDHIFETPDLVPGARIMGRRIAVVAAGKGVNVSRALHQLGVSSIVTGFVGADQAEAFESRIVAFGGQPQMLTVPSRTRQNFTLVDPVTRVETRIRDSGFGIREADLPRMAKKINLLSGADRLVVFGGPLPDGMTPEQFRTLVDVCPERSARVSVDAPAEAMRALANASLWLVKVNDDELAALAGVASLDENPLIEAGIGLSRYIRTVIWTRGCASGYCFTGGAAMLGEVPIEPERIVSSVGCGDCLQAGFIAGQLRGDDIRASYRFGLAVAAAAAVHPVPGDFDSVTVEEFLSKAEVVGVGE
jgi:1-phosphofructokinase